MSAIECRSVEDRRQLTEAIQRACNPAPGAFDALPADGSERALIVSFSVLHGIVNEYLEGGDQLVEQCTCGAHTGPPPTQGGEHV